MTLQIDPEVGAVLAALATENGPMPPPPPVGDVENRSTSAPAAGGQDHVGEVVESTFDRHSDLQIILGHWGGMLVPFADPADLLSAASTHLERRILDYITANLNARPGTRAPSAHRNSWRPPRSTHTPRPSWPT